MEQLYNNIILPDIWPSRYKEETLGKPLPVPYLESKPDHIDISIGRQLFVDDFLISHTDLIREFPSPKTSEAPVFRPEIDMELNDGYCTYVSPFNGGVFYDAYDQMLKMWYQAGWFDGSAYAESEDGLHQTRLSQLASGSKTDRVLEHVPGYMRDGDAVWTDPDTDNLEERYKMLTFYRCFDKDYRYYHLKPRHAHDDPQSIPPREMAVLYQSSDGIRWKKAEQIGPSGDNTTFFHNPFRNKWVYSMRIFSKLDSRVRVRRYYETDDFFRGSQWMQDDIRFWARTDICDKPDPEMGYYTQLYNLDAVAYEGVMLGVYSVFMGPPNFACEKTGMPKINDLKLAFNRNGFHFHRLTYDNFLSSSHICGKWNYGYLHPANGICTVVGDEIWFFYSAFSGEPPVFGTHKYSEGAMGITKLRRDGFAAMKPQDEKGELTTEILKYQGEYVSVNVDCPKGELAVEILDESGNVIPGYLAVDCITMAQDRTKYRIRWEARDFLDPPGDKIRLRFTLKDGKLYSFWITNSAEGKSHEYLAAGTLELKRGNRDD